MKRLVLLGVALLMFGGTVPALVAGPAMAQESDVTFTASGLSDFCGEFEEMDISLVVDQSGSLKTTDPDQERLTAGEGYIRNLAALPLDVSINISGFGDEFTEGTWVSLGDDVGVGEAVDDLASIVTAPLQKHTDYVLAMQGALDSFKDRPRDATCRVFVWFTDGKHDLTPANGEKRPYTDNLELYEEIVGSNDAPTLSKPIHTNEDALEVGALLAPLTCNARGFGDQLVSAEIYSQVILLDREGTVAREKSWKTVIRMTEGGDECGTHGVEDPGEIFEVDSIDELLWTLSCPPQVPGTISQVFDADSFPASLGDVAPGVATGLITRVFVSALGSEGLQLSSSSSGTSAGTGTIASFEEVFEDGSPPPSGWELGIDSGTVDKVCSSVTVESPTVIAVGGDDLRTSESGGYILKISGPFGALSDADVRLLEIDSEPGVRSAIEELRWILETVPGTLEVFGTISGEAFDEVEFRQQLNVLPERGFPYITMDDDELIGEGPGPFPMPVTLEPGDGGELCLDTEEISVIDEDGETLNGTVKFSEGGPCVTDFTDPPDALVVEFDAAAFVPDGQFTLEFTSKSGGNEVLIEFDVPTRLTRTADERVLWPIFLLIIFLYLLMFWVVLYMVNRRSVRIPNLRNHRWYRFDAASPESTAISIQSIDLNDTRRPSSSAGAFTAGPLLGRRHVPFVRVWQRPSIDLSLEGPEFSASIASRFRRSSNGKVSVTRGDIENGQIVVLPDEGAGSSGVLFTKAPPAGSNAETEFLRQLTGGVQDIQRQNSQYTIH